MTLDYVMLGWLIVVFLLFLTDYIEVYVKLILVPIWCIMCLIAFLIIEGGYIWS